LYVTGYCVLSIDLGGIIRDDRLGSNEPAGI
jgi:hypothetical protein